MFGAKGGGGRRSYMMNDSVTNEVVLGGGNRMFSGASIEKNSLTMENNSKKNNISSSKTATSNSEFANVTFVDNEARASSDKAGKNLVQFTESTEDTTDNNRKKTEMSFVSAENDGHRHHEKSEYAGEQIAVAGLNESESHFTVGAMGQVEKYDESSRRNRDSVEIQMEAEQGTGSAGFVVKGNADHNFVIVVIGNTAFAELVCILRGILAHPFIGFNRVTVLVEEEPPEQLVEMYRSMGVQFFCGVLEREMNLISCGVHEADYLVMLNGQAFDNDYLEQDRRIVSMVSAVRGIIAAAETNPRMMFECNLGMESLQT